MDEELCSRRYVIEFVKSVDIDKFCRYPQMPTLQTRNDSFTTLTFTQRLVNNLPPLVPCHEQLEPVNQVDAILPVWPSLRKGMTDSASDGFLFLFVG